MVAFWLGGYGPDMQGTAEGIGFMSTQGGSRRLAFRGTAAPVASPSWLAAHPRLDVVYAALEGEGTVQAFARSGEQSLTPLGDALPAGDAVCHLAVSPDARVLIASCYGDGQVVKFDLAADGSLRTSRADAAAELRAALFGEPAKTIEHSPQPTGIAPGESGLVTADWQTDATSRERHAHCAVFLDDGRIVTTDLGRDLVRIWRPDMTIHHEVALPPGTGPRHMVLHPSGHLHVVTEYSCEVFTLAQNRDGYWQVAGATLVAPEVNVGSDFPAEIVRSRDGETLYVGVRGRNTIAALRVRDSGVALSFLAEAWADVDWPRHHIVFDGTILVAGERSNGISVVDIDERTGAPTEARHHVQAPTPTHILPLR